MGDLDVNVVFCPLLGCKGTPFHLALNRLRTLSQPTFKLVIRHGGLRYEKKSTHMPGG